MLGLVHSSGSFMPIHGKHATNKTASSSATVSIKGTPTQRAPAEIVVQITATSIFVKHKNAELSFKCLQSMSDSTILHRATFMDARS